MKKETIIAIALMLIVAGLIGFAGAYYAALFGYAEYKGVLFAFGVTAGIVRFIEVIRR